ncbi:hypothetical protein [Aurantiacibacter gangjinensis]|uniref:Uncharacterized protein n=1 Tax=Aurantiacibacter gangjinensis TaxID=502682 RepID=A0A0G9MQH7_9SPHN|nr:hypothetical protein [Aurantiacibacter gangjinensis]APE28846.1 hypothetical protein BMF35_a2017 [Aurantiacibacter gangjinensis]KLE32987.1 hypothetical protein AAW01_02980 [Aurantiacibacter gangjinensis]
MKKLIAIAGAMALAACGGDAEEPAETGADETAVAPMNDATAPGTYTSTTEDGQEVVVTLANDGTYTVTEGGEQMDAGTWEDTENGTCLTAPGAEPTCFDITPGSENGMYDITGPDGQAMSYSYES